MSVEPGFGAAGIIHLDKGYRLKSPPGFVVQWFGNRTLYTDTFTSTNIPEIVVPESDLWEDETRLLEERGFEVPSSILQIDTLDFVKVN
jgi:hypothetical protein